MTSPDDPETGVPESGAPAQPPEPPPASEAPAGSGAATDDGAAPETPSEPGAGEEPAEKAQPAKGGLWSRLQSTAQKIASATKDAAAKAAHVTAEVARETVNVAREGAQESAEMAKHTVSHFDEVRQQTGAAFSKVGKAVSDSTVSIAQSASKTIATASTEAVKSIVANINEALPFLERAGYRVSEIELGLSVPPKVLLHLALDEEISDEVREALLKDCEGKWFTRQLIERLHNVRQIQRATQFVGMAFDEIEIEIALIPTILLHYRKVHAHRKLDALTPLADAAEAREDAAKAETAPDGTAGGAPSGDAPAAS